LKIVASIEAGTDYLAPCPRHGWSSISHDKKEKKLGGALESRSSKKKSSLLPFPNTSSSSFLVHSNTTIMGTGKKEATRRVRQGKTGDGLGNVRVKGENFYRYEQIASFILASSKC
jgi:hypothetical protein